MLFLKYILFPCYWKWSMEGQSSAKSWIKFTSQWIRNILILGKKTISNWTGWQIYEMTASTKHVRSMPNWCSGLKKWHWIFLCLRKWKSLIVNLDLDPCFTNKIDIIYNFKKNITKKKSLSLPENKNYSFTYQHNIERKKGHLLGELSVRDLFTSKWAEINSKFLISRTTS